MLFEQIMQSLHSMMLMLMLILAFFSSFSLGMPLVPQVRGISFAYGVQQYHDHSLDGLWDGGQLDASSKLAKIPFME
jgi:hypothetical protein